MGEEIRIYYNRRIIMGNAKKRTHLARSPQVLQELNSITESWNEMGQAEGVRLKQQYHVDL
ncbi:hypothetical protein KR093_003382 [Drosophila rubida]|uniref:Uncharacterized protein n=1 Tax=Drosophila rubida TaxID=30044 RepID=A0AAD4PKR9_9MUSC|nr:hypothetical protein KR093_003382 [Drosophila rubida]